MRQTIINTALTAIALLAIITWMNLCDYGTIGRCIGIGFTVLTILPNMVWNTWIHKLANAYYKILTEEDGEKQ